MNKKKNDLKFNNWFRDENYIRQTLAYMDLHLWQVSEIMTVGSATGNVLKACPFDPEINSIGNMIMAVLHLEADKFHLSDTPLDDILRAPIFCLVNIDVIDSKTTANGDVVKKANVLRPSFTPDVDLTKFVWLVGDLKFPLA